MTNRIASADGAGGRQRAWRPFVLRWCAAAALLTALAAPSRSSAQTLYDPNLAVTQAVAGLSQPIGIAFIGPDTFLVIEKASGQVKVVSGGTVAGVALDLAVNSASERGLLGIALHPDFPADPSVYLFWTASSTGADTTVVGDVPLLANRVDRFALNPGPSPTLTFTANVIGLRARQIDTAATGTVERGNHNGGKIAFGPDRKLYVFVGDTGRRGWMQNLPNGPYVTPPFIDDQFGGPAPDSAHLTGVVLRLNDDGSAPADNPHFGTGAALGGEAGANVQKVFSYGHRNGFGMAFDPAGGHLWATENGDDSFDEVNRIVGGGNYGWVQSMGPISRIVQYKVIESNLFAPPAAGGSLQQFRWPPTRIMYTPAGALSRMFMLPGSSFTDPELSWRYSVSPAGLGFVNGSGLGAAYAGTLWSGSAVAATLTGGSNGPVPGGYLMAMRLTPDRLHLDLSADPGLADRVADNGIYPPPRGTPPSTAGFKYSAVESETLLVGENFGVSADILTGPDGALYVVSLTHGAVYRIAAAP